LKSILQEVGQRFMVGFEGHTASADVRRLIRDFGLGNVILFARNVDSPEQVAELVRELQAIARDAGHETPLLIAIDQEGGKVQRLRKPWTEWPPIKAIGELGQGGEDAARRMGQALAAELLACGVRLDFAPVVDVDTNPKNPIIGALGRSFSSDPDKVGRLAAAMIDGLQKSGVAACAKHFPGHGDVDVDSHLDLPFSDVSRQRLKDVELRPFKHAAEAGVATVMTAHVLYRELDDKYPATLSPHIIKENLRQNLGYDGVVFGDDLEMKAVAARWPYGEAAVLAARAGCDMLLVCKEIEAQVAAIEGLIRGLEAEAIPFTERDDSRRRIRRLKQQYVIPYTDPDPKRARQTAGVGEHRQLAAQIAEAGGFQVNV
jgi:beta-N-acetylhexosaminidase